MKRSLLFLLLLFFGCNPEDEKPLAHQQQEERVIPSPKEEAQAQPEQKQIAKSRRKTTPAPTAPQPESEPKPVVVEKQTLKEKQVEEPAEEIQKALNRTVFEESFGWRAMNAVPVPAPPKHPDSLKWEDISGGPGTYMSPSLPWWIKWLGYLNMAAAVIFCGYLLITNK